MLLLGRPVDLASGLSRAWMSVVSERRLADNGDSLSSDRRRWLATRSPPITSSDVGLLVTAPTLVAYSSRESKKMQ